MNKKTHGFTLIELLVVIAIIGILSSTVLISLTTARTKATDVKVKSGVKQMKTVLEANFDGVTYPDLTNTVADQLNGGVNGGLVATGNPGNDSIAVIIADVAALGGDIFVSNDPNTEGDPALGYAVYGRLVSDVTTTHFCLDSKGKSSEGVMPDPLPAECPVL